MSDYDMDHDPEWIAAMRIGRTDEVLAAGRKVLVRIRVKREFAERRNEKAAEDYIRQAPEPWI